MFFRFAFRLFATKNAKLCEWLIHIEFMNLGSRLLLTSCGFAEIATYETLYFPQPQNEVTENIFSTSNRRAILQNRCCAIAFYSSILNILE